MLSSDKHLLQSGPLKADSRENHLQSQQRAVTLAGYWIETNGGWEGSNLNMNNWHYYISLNFQPVKPTKLKNRQVAVQMLARKTDAR